MRARLCSTDPNESSKFDNNFFVSGFSTSIQKGQPSDGGQ